MTEGKNAIPKYDGKPTSDFNLWCKRLQAILDGKGLWRYIALNEEDNDEEDERRKVSSIIVQALTDKPLRVIINDIGNPRMMMEKLNHRYASSNMTSRMSLMFQLLHLKYKGGEMGEYVDKYTCLLDQLESMEAKVPETLAVIMFLSSLDEKYESTVAALRQMEKDFQWDDITNRIIEEGQRHLSQRITKERTYVTSERNETKCKICSRPHFTEICWWNPKNPKNRLRKRDEERAKTTKVDSNQQSQSKTTQIHAKPVVERNLQMTCMSTQLVLDSGASAHMFMRRDFFQELHEIPEKQILLGDNTSTKAKEAGNVSIDVTLGGDTRKILLLTDVLFVPGLGTNLVSCAALDKKQVSIEFAKGSCSLIDLDHKNQIIARGALDNGLYLLKGEVINTKIASYMADSLDLWHRRLAHVNKETVRKMITAKQLSDIINPKTDTCIECREGKQTRSSFKNDGGLDFANKKGEVIFSDIVGPLPPTQYGERYFISFIDGSTRFAVIKLIKRKSEALESFKSFQKYFERQNGVKLKAIHSDNGGEYEPIGVYATNNGIKHQTTSPYTPESNGIAERLNRTVVESTRTTLRESGLPTTFWGYALLNSVAIRNKLPDSKGSSPYERLTARKPDLNGFRPFGCQATVHIEKGLREKLDPKVKLCILLGNLGSGLYCLYDIGEEQIIKSRHVKFNENLFPARNLQLGNKESFEVIYDDDYIQEPDNVSETTVDQQSESDHSEPHINDASNEEQEVIIENIDTTNTGVSEPQSIHERRYPLRTRRATRSDWYRGQTSANKASECHGKSEAFDLDSQQCHNNEIIESDYPTLKQALSGVNKERWLQAINEEMEALKAANTWTVTEIPKGQKVLPSQFILRVKRGSGGEIVKYKARLVVLGNLQRPNIDYFETYAPVVEFTVVRVLLILASTLNLTIRQLDVKSAFLNGHLKETIFMSLPKDFALPNGQVCHLKKSLYGLKQAPKAWNEKLTADFEKINFKPSRTTESVFYQREKGRTTFLLLYVDDMLILAPTEEQANQVVQQIKGLYEIKDLGKAEFFLGVKIEQLQGKVIKISQSRYINELLERFEMQTCKPISTPLSNEGNWFERLNLTTAEENEMKYLPYREAIGSLLFLSTRTRPDIATAVNILAKHSETPHPQHWKGVKRIFRYLQGTKNEGILLQGAKTLQDLHLECYVDADWGTDLEDRSSRTGVICCLSGSPVWWKSRKQQSIAVSTCEAEYMALFEGVKDVIWLRNVLCEFDLCPGNTPTTIFADNQSSITWANNPGLRKVKHIDLRYNFSQQQIEKKVIRVEYVQSSDNAADILTKNLGNCLFQKAKKLLSISA